jgi:hypothetical protein
VPSAGLDFVVEHLKSDWVEIRIQQGSGDRIQFPNVVLRPLGEVHDHP